MKSKSTNFNVASVEDFDDFQYTVRNHILGEGTFGVVKKGSVTKNGKKCVAAIKLIEFDKLKLLVPEENAEEFIENEKPNIRKEIETLKRIKHEHIIKYLGAKEEKNRFVIATELCDETLHSLFKKMSEKERLADLPKFTRQIVLALEYLVENNLVHKDIKPKNLFVKIVNKDGNDVEIIKVGDLGVTKEIKAGGIMTATERSTPAYTSPEFEEAILKLKTLGRDHPRTKKEYKKLVPGAIDVFALGVCLFEVATGKYPLRIYDNDDNPIIPKTIKGDLRSFIEGCLKYKAKERLTAKQLLDHKYIRAKSPPKKPCGEEMRAKPLSGEEMNEEGDDVEQNFKSVEWYRKSAEEGNDDTSMFYSLGYCYENGIGVEKNPALTFQWYRKAAEKGNDNAMRNLGVCYLDGTGVEKNPELAVEWYRKATEKGNITAMFYLGHCYENGIGVEKNPELAFELYQKAAEKGNDNAMRNLGVCYLDGTGVEKNPKLAVEWYQKAAEKGNETATYYLGHCYENGTGVEKNPGLAVQWYRKAAEKGNDNAMRNLGVCYENGIGVEKNHELAVEWWRKAAEKGNQTAMYYLGRDKE